MSGARQVGHQEGLERGQQIGRIQDCEERLVGPVTDDAKFDELGREELKSLLASLQQ